MTARHVALLLGLSALLAGCTKDRERNKGGAPGYSPGLGASSPSQADAVAPISGGTLLITDDGEQAGWSQIEQKNPAYVELARKSLIEQGVGAENIEILEPQVTGTIYEARVLSEKAKSVNLKSVLIVTSAYHTRRALSTFQRVFAEKNQQTEFGITSPPTGEQTPPPFSWWLSAVGWQIVAGEYVKSAVYWVYY